MENIKALGHIAIKGQHHPDAYSLIVDGDCLNPAVKNGEYLLVEPTYPELGEVGAFWVGDTPKGVKYITSHYIHSIPFKSDNLAMPIQAMQINPVRHYQVDASKISKLHRVVGVIQKNGKVRSIKPFLHYMKKEVA